MSKVDEIKNQLAQRLEKQASRTRPPAARPRPPRSAEAVVSTDGDKGPISRTAVDAPSPGVIKQSVSLYSPDIARLDEIKDFMREHGVRNLSDSEAMRLACRAVKVGSEFLGIYETMRNEDQRRKKAQVTRPAPAARR
jgi:hypothetical protein